MAELMDLEAGHSSESEGEVCYDSPTESDIDFIEETAPKVGKKRKVIEESDEEGEESEGEPLVRQLAMPTPSPSKKSTKPAKKKGGWKGYKSKGHFLTYPNVNDKPTKEMVMDKLSELLQKKHRSFVWDDETCWMVVAREMHESGAPHFHVFIQSNKPLNVIKQDHFDLVWEEGEIEELQEGRQNMKWHPNLAGSARSWSAIEKYCKKDGDFIEKGKHQIQDKIAAGASKKGVAYEKAMREGLLAAVESYPECLPELGKMQQGKLILIP